MAGGRAARAVVALAVVGLVAGCTTDPGPEPSPTPTPTASAATDAVVRAGDRVTVVVPPVSLVAGAEAAALAQAASELAVRPPTGVAHVRVVEAASEAFARDLVNLAADDGDDIVCIVGTGSADLALELARERRDTRFCTTDGNIAGGPVNLVAVAPDPVALVRAGAIAIGTAPAPVGLLLSPQLGDAELLTATFVEAVAPPVQPSPPPTGPGTTTTTTPTPTPTPTVSVTPPGPTAPQPPFVTIVSGTASAAQVVAGEQLGAERPSRALVLTTPGGAAAAAAAAADGAALVGVVDWLVDDEGEPPSNLLVGLTVDWAALLADAIVAAQDDEPTQVQVRGSEILGALPGRVQGAARATERTTAFLEQPPGE